ncbi:MAG: Mammalian cell entry related domain protein [Candidatus Roizmanbacteria bacterium GW2011_GWC2_41_7]|uniref:Mammalian cell entry related domain protein n=1 Tax=Candidatus Roizmanbacteria bacterium GW2011_GWC2_41_7 TaxID=1618487 RepID=A0A0G0XE92_9BACT|nr:MAG: Mammalian cell entry related domain protein [Candidatus Roizmanbacteria bacterium GW2011_GWC2_41_7]
MSSTQQSIRVAIFFFFGAALLWIVYSTLSKSTFYQESGYLIRAVYHDVKMLKEGDDVRMSGVQIGTVGAIVLRDDEFAQVELRIKHNFTIPKDSTAVIGSVGLLGGNYISISAGALNDNLQPNDEIKTTSSFDIQSVISQFGDIGSRIDGILKGFEGTEDSKGGKDGKPSAKPLSLFSNLNELVTENRPRIENILTNLDTITQKIAKGEGTLGKLINDDTAYKNFNDTFAEIRNAAKNADKLMASASEIVDKIKKGEGPLGALLTDTGISDQIRDAVKNVDEFSKKLNNDKSTLGRVISDDKLYLKAEDTFNKIDRAVDSLEDNGPMTAVGVAASALF